MREIGWLQCFQGRFRFISVRKRKNANLGRLAEKGSLELRKCGEGPLDCRG